MAADAAPQLMLAEVIQVVGALDPMPLYRKQEAVEQKWFAKNDSSDTTSRLR